MIERFVDTSGWAAWADKTLAFHALAMSAFEEVWNQGGRFITSSLVLVELAALLTRPLRMPKSQQIQLLDDLRSDPRARATSMDAMALTPRQGLERDRLRQF